jgi:predicted O-methyltransferase YrrM
MARPFVQHYDAIYADKDYDSDIAAFESLAEPISLTGKRLLEIGAGTGNHTLRLAPMVAELACLEIDPDFSEVLAAKLADAALPNVTRYACRLQELPARGFNAAAAFFHVLNYVGPGEMEEFLASLAARLEPGAPFVADLWNGAAALRDPPREERREKRAGAARVVQHIRPDLDRDRRMVTLNYEISVEGAGGTRSFRERLVLYLWLREELAALLRHAGFAEVDFFDYRSWREPATERSWRLWLRARRA